MIIAVAKYPVGMFIISIMVVLFVISSIFLLWYVTYHGIDGIKLKYKAMLLNKLKWDSERIPNILSTLPEFLSKCKISSYSSFRRREYEILQKHLSSLDEFAEMLKQYNESIYSKRIEEITKIKMFIYVSAIDLYESSEAYAYTDAISTIRELVENIISKHEAEINIFVQSKAVKKQLADICNTLSNKIAIISKHNPIGNSYEKYVNRQRDIFNSIVHSEDEEIRKNVHRIISNLRNLDKQLDAKIQKYPSVDSKVYVEKLLSVEDNYLKSIEESHYEDFL